MTCLGRRLVPLAVDYDIVATHPVSFYINQY